MRNNNFYTCCFFFFSFAALNAQVTPGKTTTKSGAKTRNASEMVAAGFKRYNVESGIVEYTLNGAKKGTEKLYFDMWGWREARYESGTIKMMGIEQKSETVQYLDGEWMISYDPQTNYATRMGNPMFKKLTEKSDTKNMTELGEKMLENMGGKVTGTETIAGKLCRKWEISSLKSTAWVWNGLTLKESSTMMNISMEKIATAVQTGIAPPAEKLTVPKDAKGIKTQLPFKE